MYLLSFLRFWTLSIEQFLIFILVYFEWRDTENQQYVFVFAMTERKRTVAKSRK